MYKDQDQLQLIAQSEEEVESWKASLLRAGVYPEAQKSTAPVSHHMSGSTPILLVSLIILFVQDPDLGSIDPQLERQIETIRNLVESYIDIVIKTVKDQVPKAIMYMIVNKVS